MSEWQQEFEQDYPNDQALVHEVEERGALRERERIIARLRLFKNDLLDDAISAAETGGDPAWDIERAEAVERCIALIEGENA